LASQSALPDVGDLLPAIAELAWPSAVAFAWLTGEAVHRVTGVPRISVYGLVGFALGATQLGFLPLAPGPNVILLANVAFGLILFEFGYRINLRWLRTNPWIGVTGILESVATFVVVYLVSASFGAPSLTALLLASLAMSTSPAALMLVVNEERSSGQLTERILHLTAVNCVLGLFVFKAIVGYWTFQSSGSLLHAVLGSLNALLVSAGLGAAFGLAVPAVLRRFGHVARDATVAFAIGVVLLVAVTHALRLSPVLAALSFGLVARHRRVSLSPTQRNFGVLGDLLAVVLFMFVASTLEWQRVWAGLGLALAIIGARLLAKVIVVGGLARVSGITFRKGVLTGAALMPISVFVILLLEEARYFGLELTDQLAPLAAVALLLELIGPVATQRALMAAGESSEAVEKR
jgi:Kef-type K+ transport system membrane component KefB